MAEVWKAKYVSPMLAVDDMDASVAFYRDVLGFTAFMHTPEYSILQRDDRLIHLKLAWAPEDIMKVVRLHTEVYLEVEGIEALWAHVRTFKDRYHVRDLFERLYGMTEFHIRDNSGFLLFIGEVTSQVK
ncbi:MAG TPA: VOC family protein [Acidisarcina sp.]